MTKKLNLALIYGGPSGEHEISLRSAASVLKQLNQERYNILPIGIDKAGMCFYNPVESLLSCKQTLPVKTAASKPLSGLLINGKFALPADVVLPVVHGPLLEDGALQGLLELAQIAYVGSGVLSSAIAMDKDIARKLLSLDGVKSTAYTTLSIHSTEDEKNAICESVFKQFKPPVFVKPCCMGSSVGIHKVSLQSQLKAAILDAFRYDETIIIEQGVQGLEIELAVLENPASPLVPLVSVPGELKVHHQDGFYSYQAKYIDSDLTELIIPAPLSTELTHELQRIAALVFTRLKCKGLSRVDFFVNPETNMIYFNEINTLPGFTSISMYPRLWEASGIDYSTLLDKLIEVACLNQKLKENRLRDYT